MTEKVSKHISIPRYQEEWIKENHVKLSSLVEEKLDEEISDEYKDNKTEDESGNQ